MALRGAKRLRDYQLSNAEKRLACEQVLAERAKKELAESEVSCPQAK